MKKSVIVTMSIIVSLALGELYLRLLLPQQTYGRLPDTGSGCYRDDTELYALPKPDGSCSAKTSEYSVETPINHQGFVGIDAVAPEKAPDTIRVAFIGDSYTFGQGVPFTSAYPYVTGQLLTKNGRKTEVINASMIGAGPHWYYLRLKTSVMRFAPDIVVVGLYLGNDLTDTTYFTSGTDDADGMPLSVRTPNEYVDGSGKRQAAETPLRYRIPILRDSHLFMLIARGMFGPVELGGNRAINGNPCMLDPSCTAMDGMIHKTVKLMAGMRDLTRNGHSKLLVVLIPWELQLPRRILALSRINFYATDAHRHTMTAKVERELEKVGIPTLDLLPAFEAYTGTEPLVWPEDRHWTAAGHRLTAEALAPALIGMTGATPSAEKE